MASLTTPVSQGPTEQPISPEMASRPNMAVPPKGKRRAVAETVPGHINPTETPHSAQPMSARNGMVDRTAVK